MSVCRSCSGRLFQLFELVAWSLDDACSTVYSYNYRDPVIVDGSSIGGITVGGIVDLMSIRSICLIIMFVVCVPADSDVARGSYNIQQVQLAFAHAYHVLCNAVRNDDTRQCKKNSTGEHFLCTDSILSHVICMPHQHDLPCQRSDIKLQKLTYSERKSSYRKQTTPQKKHRLNVTRWFMPLSTGVHWTVCNIFYVGVAQNIVSDPSCSRNLAIFHIRPYSAPALVGFGKKSNPAQP